MFSSSVKPKRPLTFLQEAPKPNQHQLSSSSSSHKPRIWKRILNRFDTIESAGLDDDDSDQRQQVQVSGIFRRIKQLHNPITYLIIATIAGFRYDWCFRNPYYWFAVGFCIKWYRARYVFKIPVWDRQPNWNNIITSKEQEKDLKAFTCKNCGSTLFIAKTREFFFEGDTGIGGLGCFACGAKGKDNFVMDRDRIVEDVADMDDYFEYERPLDFVSRAERRKLLKETKGDEEKANEILLQRAVTEEAGTEQAQGETSAPAVQDAEIVDAIVVEDETSAESVAPTEDATEEESVSETARKEEMEPEAKEVEPKADPFEPKLKKSKPKPPPTDDDLDILGMDAF